MRVNRVLIAALVCVQCGVAVAVQAQVPAPANEMLPRPYRGIYGGNSANSAGVAHSLEMTLSLWGGSDENTGYEGSFADPQQSIGGPYSAGGAAFSYAWRGRSVEFGASASSQSRYYPDFQEFLGGIHTGGVGFEASLSPRTRIQAQQSVAFTPLFAVNPFPDLGTPVIGEPVAPNADLTLAQRDTLALGSTAGVSHVVSSRSSIGAGYAYNATLYSEGATDLRYHTAVVRWDQRISRNAFLAPVYNFQNAQYQLGAEIVPVKAHEATVEIGREWVHSRTRRSELRVNAGGALVDMEDRQVTRPVGGVRISTMVGQSWDLRGSYQRGVDFIPGLSDVSYVDSVGFLVSGLITSRVDANFSVSYATGDVGFDDVRSRYSAYTAVGRLGVAVHRTAAFFGEAFYYSATDNAPLTPGDPGSRDRNRLGFRAGMSWWVPFVRERQRRDTR